MTIGRTFEEAFALFANFLGRFAVTLTLLLAGLSLFWVVLAPDEEGFLAFVVTLLGTSWGEATMVEDIHDRHEGAGDASILELYRRTWRLAFRVACATFLVSLLIGLLAGVSIWFALTVAAALGADDWWVAAIAVAWAVLVPLYMLARWSLLLPVIVIEHRGTLAALGRSSELVLPARWKVFAVVTTSLALGVGLSTAVAAGIESAASGGSLFGSSRPSMHL